MRSGADIKDYSLNALKSVTSNIKASHERTKADGAFHKFTLSGQDYGGRWLMVFATGPNLRPAQDALHDYLMLKKHHLRANRALGVLLDPHGNPTCSFWLCDAPKDDPGLDARIRALGWTPLDRVPRAIPPSAKGNRKKAKKKRRRR